MMRRSDIEGWLREYFRCWREKDSKALANLFTPEAIYRSSPFREPYRGTEAIQSYWARATHSQKGIVVRVGTPVCEGDRVAVEWWAIWNEEGNPVTLPGCLVLRFSSDKRCEELREYWHHESAIRDPPESWGA